MSDNDMIGKILAGALLSGQAKVAGAMEMPNGNHHIHPEGQIARLQEVAERYHAPCPFAVGDIVVPRPDAGLKYENCPHLIVEVLPNPAPNFVTSEHGDASFGAKVDVRVALMPERDTIVMFWQESWKLMPYSRD